MNNKMIEKDEREKRIDSKRLGLAGGVGLLSMTVAIIYKMNDSYNKRALNMDILVFVLVLSFTVLYYIKLKVIENKKNGLMHKQFNLKFDERESHLLIQALNVSAVLAFVLTTLSMMLKLLIFDFISFARIDFGILIAMSLVMIIYSFFAKDYMIPKISKSIDPITKRNLIEKNSRMVVYFKKSMRFSIIFTLFSKYYLKNDLVSYPDKGSIIFPFLMNAVLSFILYFILTYLWSEFNVKKMNRFLDELENGE